MNIRSLYAHRVLLGLLVAAALAVASMTILVIRQQRSQADGQVFLEAGGSSGANPFIPLVVPPTTPGGSQRSAGTSFQTTASADSRMTCDSEKLVAYLAGNPQASEAWVRAINSDRALSWSGGSRVEIQQVPSYIRELTPRLLAEDLRVTNYQFTNGSALAVQSVLEKGTAVLVDAKGIARIRCACGNPLTPMTQLKMPPIYRGTPWPNFRPQRVVLTQPGPRCGDAEYRGGDGRCHGPDQPGPFGIDKHPNPPRWWDEPIRPTEPPYPDKPGRPDEPPHSGRPGPDGFQPRYPDGPRQQPDEPYYPGRSSGPDATKHPDNPVVSDQPVHPDKPAVPDQPGHPDKPASSHKDEPAEDRPVGSKAGYKSAQPRAEPDKSAVPNQRVHQRSNPPQDEAVRPARQDRPDKPAPRDTAGTRNPPAPMGKAKTEQSDRTQE
jgi:uncharacterized protein DUF6777